MTLPALAELDALEDRLGESLSGADATRAQAALDHADALVRAEAADNFTDPDDDGSLDPDIDPIVTQIVLTAAERAYRNPDGWRTHQESLGSYSDTVTYAGPDDSMTGVYLTKTERRLVRRAGGTRSIGSHLLQGPYDVNTLPGRAGNTVPAGSGDELTWVTLGDENAY